MRLFSKRNKPNKSASKGFPAATPHTPTAPAAQPSDLKARSAMPHPGRTVQQEIDFILCHDEYTGLSAGGRDDVPVAVEQSLGRLEALGDGAVPHIVSAVTGCATGGCPGPYWWDGARELCKLLSRLRSPAANAGLLSILRRTDSNIAEFNFDVRRAAARALGASGDQALVEELASCLDLPNFPHAEIAEAIEALGGSASDSPAVIVDRAQDMFHVEAIRYLLGHRSSVPAWPEDTQRWFYWVLAVKVDYGYGRDKAKPLYAAALRADPGPRSAAWTGFSESERRETVQTLSAKYPLSDGYWEALKVAVESSDVV